MFQVNPLLGREFTWKNQALFSSKEKCKKLKCRPLQFLIGALRVNDQDLIFKIFFSYKTGCWSCSQTEKSEHMCYMYFLDTHAEQRYEH